MGWVIGWKTNQFSCSGHVCALSPPPPPPWQLSSPSSSTQLSAAAQHLLECENCVSCAKQQQNGEDMSRRKRLKLCFCLKRRCVRKWKWRMRIFCLRWWSYVCAADFYNPTLILQWHKTSFKRKQASSSSVGIARWQNGVDIFRIFISFIDVWLSLHHIIYMYLLAIFHFTSVVFCPSYAFCLLLVRHHYHYRTSVHVFVTLMYLIFMRWCRWWSLKKTLGWISWCCWCTMME